MKAPSTGFSFPLCTVCHHFTRQPPPLLCPTCGVRCDPADFSQSLKCALPWRTIPMVEAFFTRYLFDETNFYLFKEWKKKRGLLFDRILLSDHSIDPLFELVQTYRPLGVIGIPQSWSRRWELKGGSSSAIAQWAAKTLRIPILPLLQTTNKKDSQALRSKEERILQGHSPNQNWTIHIPTLKKISEPNMSLIAPTYLLVDDLRTTGNTIRSVLNQIRVYKEASSIRWVVFTLGLRVSDN